MVETVNDGHRLIFIGGSPRSGTTLLQNMLDSHPQVLGGPEFLHIPDIIELRRKLHFSIAREWIDIFCSREDVDNHLIATIKRLFLSLADKHQCEFYSEKTPENILAFSELLELFPDAHFIQVLRDPRAILSSMQQVKQRAISKGLNPPSFTANTSTSINYIKRCFNAGIKATQRAPNKILTVSYEQLVADPENEAKKICSHLGIPWDDLMLRPGDKQHLGDQAITTKSDEIWYDSKTYNRNIAAQNPRKWTKQLSLVQQLRATIAFDSYKEYQKYGYNFSVLDLARDHGALSRCLIYGIFLARAVWRSVIFVSRKIPGASTIKNRIHSVAGILKIKTR